MSTPPLTPRIVRAAMIAALLLGLASALPVAYGTWISARCEAWAGRALGGPQPPAWEPAPSADPCAARCPVRAMAARAIQTTVQAAKTSDPRQRAELLARTEDLLSRALASEPVNGEWWAWLTYARWLQGGDPVELMNDLARSYQTAPFLAAEGPWRDRLAAIHWPRLDPTTRARLIDEVVWLRDIDPDGFASVLPAFFDPPAMRALALGLARPPALSVAHRRGGIPDDVTAAN